MPCPCETRTSTWRSFATISSGLYRFLAIAVLLDVKDIPQVGPLQWGRITSRSWCAVHPRHGTENCGYTSFDQCWATIGSEGGWCRPNPFPGSAYGTGNN